MPVRPQVLALVMCDLVHRDPATGKHALLGCFAALSARTFPTVHPHLAVYAVVTEIYGAVPLSVRLVRPDGYTRVAEATAELRADDPRTVAEVSLAFHDVPLPAAEELRLQLCWHGELLLERRLQVLAARG